MKMTTMSLFSLPSLNSGFALVNPSLTTFRTDAHASTIVSLTRSCGPSTLCLPSSYSSSEASFRGKCSAGASGSRATRLRNARGYVRAVHGSSNATSTDAEERVRVKQELLSLLERTEGNMTQECLDLIATLEKLNPNPEPSKVPELMNGCFITVKSTLKGKESADAGVFSSTFTLQRAAFGAFKPLKQEVILLDTYNHVRYANDEEYVLASEITIKNNDGELPEQLEGYLINHAKCSFAPGSEKLTIRFLSSVLRPKNPENETELQSWKKLFQEHNPGMDEQGFMTVKLPGAEGFMEHLYLDDEIRISRGNMNNTYVVRRLPGPVIQF